MQPNLKCLDLGITVSTIVRVSQGFWETKEHWQTLKGTGGSLWGTGEQSFTKLMRG